jgi:hypothetical protein
MRLFFEEFIEMATTDLNSMSIEFCLCGILLSQLKRSHEIVGDMFDEAIRDMRNMEEAVTRSGISMVLDQ